MAARGALAARGAPPVRAAAAAAAKGTGDGAPPDAMPRAPASWSSGSGAGAAAAPRAAAAAAACAAAAAAAAAASPAAVKPPRGGAGAGGAGAPLCGGAAKMLCTEALRGRSSRGFVRVLALRALGDSCTITRWAPPAVPARLAMAPPAAFGDAAPPLRKAHAA